MTVIKDFQTWFPKFQSTLAKIPEGHQVQVGLIVDGNKAFRELGLEPIDSNRTFKETGEAAIGYYERKS